MPAHDTYEALGPIGPTECSTEDSDLPPTIWIIDTLTGIGPSNKYFITRDQVAEELVSSFIQFLRGCKTGAIKDIDFNYPYLRWTIKFKDGTEFTRAAHIKSRG